MWLLELVFLSLVIGLPLGICLRVWDEWREKNLAEVNKLQNKEIE